MQNLQARISELSSGVNRKGEFIQVTQEAFQGVIGVVPHAGHQAHCDRQRLCAAHHREGQHMPSGIAACLIMPCCRESGKTEELGRFVRISLCCAVFEEAAGYH